MRDDRLYVTQKRRLCTHVLYQAEKNAEAGHVHSDGLYAQHTICHVVRNDQNIEYDGDPGEFHCHGLNRLEHGDKGGVLL